MTRTISAALLLLLGCVFSARAASSTYRFEGALIDGPIDGQEQFSGTFTFGQGPGAGGPDPWYLGITPSAVSLSIGGHAIDFRYGGYQDPGSNWDLGLDHDLIGYGDTIRLSASSDKVADSAFFGKSFSMAVTLMDLADNALPQVSFTQLPTINLGDYPITMFRADFGDGTSTRGMLTALQLVSPGQPDPVPEPGALLIYSLGGAMMLLLRRRGGRAPRARP